MVSAGALNRLVGGGEYLLAVAVKKPGARHSE